MEDSQKWFNLVQRYMAWCLPVLLHESCHDDCIGYHTVLWEILRILERFSVCSYLGMLNLAHFQTLLMISSSWPSRV